MRCICSSMLGVVVAEYVLGLVDAYDLPRRAVDAISAGVENQDLAALAGAERSESPADLRELFERALRRGAIEVPTRREAALSLKRHYAIQVVEGAIAPFEGADRIRILNDNVHDLFPSQSQVGDSFGVHEIISLYWSADEFHFDTEQVARLKNAVVVACRKVASEELGLA